MVCKKTRRLLLCDYQRTARYYTIYRTFKSWSSDDFTTIPRLLATTIPEAVTTIPAGTLRLLLTLIGYRAKARKEIRRQPSMVPHRPPRPLLLGCPAGLSWSAMCCTVWHGSITGAHPYIPYYNRAAVLTCAASGTASYIWYRWRRCGVAMRSSVAQAVRYSRIHRHTTAAKHGE